MKFVSIAYQEEAYGGDSRSEFFVKLQNLKRHNLSINSKLGPGRHKSGSQHFLGQWKQAKLANTHVFLGRKFSQISQFEFHL